MTKYWSGTAAIAFVLAAGPVPVESSDPGGLAGWVEDSRGAPLPGAVISLFGRGLGGTGLVTLSDSAGRFLIPRLPAGSYMVRALRDGHQPAAARRVVVLPNQEATFTISLIPTSGDPRLDGVDADATATRSEDADRELRWLLRHRRRSSLEDRGEGLATADAIAPDSPRLLASLVHDLGGSLEVVTTPVSTGADTTSGDATQSLSVVRLQGRISDTSHWALGGLVAEHDGTAWRMAGEFVFEPGGGHELRAATGYGTGSPRMVPFTSVRLQERGTGAVSLEDNWRIAERVSATLAGRYSYAGFLPKANYVDPVVAVEVRSDDHSRLRATMSRGTVIPGGDVLTLTGVSSTASIAFAVLDEDLRAEHVVHYDVALDQDFGPLSLQAQTFYEGVQDQIVQRFDARGAGMRVANGGRIVARGMGLQVSRRFGAVVEGSMRYRFGHGSRPQAAGPEPMLAWRQGDFHDITARLETFLEGTDTRLRAFYRVNHLSSDGPAVPGGLTSTRFDVQLTQGLPFLGSLTRADWDVLVGVRNLYYDETEGAFLDELTVINPPTRIMGGISVRF